MSREVEPITPNIIESEFGSFGASEETVNSFCIGYLPYEFKLRELNPYLNFEIQQWKIAPRFYREMGTMIGELDLSKERLKDVFRAYASNLGENLITLYNALSDLSININKYFLASDKSAGLTAIQNAKDIKREADRIIEK